MDTGLKGKKVLVTGSTSGLGYGIAEAFIQEGSKVIINSGTEKNVKAAVKRLQDKYKGAEVRGITADLTKLADADRLYDDATRDGKLDVLVNNVGIFPVVPFAEITDEQWFHIFDVNVMSNVRLCRRALPDMLKANSGKIVLISSEAGFRPNKDLIHYCMTKAAQLNLARGMAELTRGTKVTVNSVLPVTTWTEGIEKYLTSIAQRDNVTLEQAKINYFKSGNDSPSLLQRFLTVEEVAKTVIFAAYNDGINGSSIAIDAGVTRVI
jgi:NAD(P)-dependent dehydrogenase (short-subunit alcohol dehydrogenase family)